MPCSTLLSDSGAHGPFRVKRVASQKGVFSDLLLTSDLVAKALRLDNSNIVDDALVEVESFVNLWILSDGLDTYLP